MNDRSFKTQRRSIRLKDFDYSSPGAYFVTICTNLRGQNWLGIIDREGMKTNDIGLMVEQELMKLPERFEHLEIDTFVIMPDHVHVIFVVGDFVGVGLVPTLGRDGTSNRETQILGDFQENNDPAQRATTRVAPTGNSILGDTVGAFKSITTHRYIKGVRELGWQPFEKRFWERNYFEHIIRNDTELEQKRNYILENPVRSQIKAGLV